METKSRFKTIDTSHDPHVNAMHCFFYWAAFVFRHYAYGGRKGIYGPGYLKRFFENLESRIDKQCRRYGPAPILEVPEVRGQDIGVEEFQKIYLSSNTPVLIKGMAKDWPAVKNWSLDYFKQNYGHEVVPTRLRGNELNEEALRYVDMPLAKLIDNIYEGGYFFSGHVEDIFNRNPHLREEINVPILQKYLCVGKISKIMSTQTFISGPGTRSGFHCTGVPNLFIMVHGVKEWTFVNPKHSLFMYPAARKDMFYSMSEIDWNQSYEDLDKAGFPLYKYIPKYFARLEAGDVLFSPQWWWHAINTTAPSIGVATRCVNKLILGQKLFSLMWITSKEFRRLAFNVLRTGWGTDRYSGAKLAFEEEFVAGVGR